MKLAGRSGFSTLFYENRFFCGPINVIRKSD